MAGGDRTVMIAFHEEVPGGATLSVLRLLDDLEGRGWRFVLWAPDPSELADHLRAAGHDVRGAPRPIVYSAAALRLPPGPRRRIASMPGYVRRLRATIAEVRPALLHANSLLSLAEASVARVSGVPVLMHVHEMRPAGRKGALGARAAAQIATEVVAVSAASADGLAVGGRRPAIVYEGAVVPEGTRAEPEGPPLVGSVGVISTRKGSDTFVEAARIVRAERPEVGFELVGAPTDELEADWAGEVLQEAQRAGVRHLRRADVPERLRAWTVFALPSRRDPFPISMLEAMAHGLPVVGAASDGIPEQLDGDAGLLVPPGDPAALAAEIMRLLDDPELRARLGAAARERVVENFSVAAQAEALNVVYERLAARDAAIS